MNLGKKEKRNPLTEEEEKLRVLSELQSNIDEADDDLIDRESLFRSRQSSIGGR
jgi:hypothetical protein